METKAKGSFPADSVETAPYSPHSTHLPLLPGIWHERLLPRSGGVAVPAGDDWGLNWGHCFAVTKLAPANLQVQDFYRCLLAASLLQAILNVRIANICSDYMFHGTCHALLRMLLLSNIRTICILPCEISTRFIITKTFLWF
jgi:hypothetical protein